MPDFTVIMATWNRSRHILPSVRSVLNQTHRDFELLVIGDEVTDDTRDYLATCRDPRLRWINNTPRWGTQSGPNNRGITEARAPFVAYIGHDDIWAPEHLAAIWDVRQRQPEADVVVSGLVAHRLTPDQPYIVRGILTQQGQELDSFVPPTATAHRREFVRRFSWPRKEDTILAVDFDYQRTLARAGATFAVTGKITAHKFASTGRYLSYFEPDSVEQEQMLSRFVDRDYPVWLERIVDHARATGGFMPEESRTSDPEATRKRLARVAKGRGVEGLPANLPVGDGISLLQSNDPRFLDWRPMKPRESYRMAGANPNPRLLIPLTTKKPVQLRLRLSAQHGEHLEALRIRLNGIPIRHDLQLNSVGLELALAELIIEGPLREDRASVIVIEQLANDIRSGRTKSTLAVGPFTATPLRQM